MIYGASIEQIDNIIKSYKVIIRKDIYTIKTKIRFITISTIIDAPKGVVIDFYMYKNNNEFKFLSTDRLTIAISNFNNTIKEIKNINKSNNLFIKLYNTIINKINHI